MKAGIPFGRRAVTSFGPIASLLVGFLFLVLAPHGDFGRTEAEEECCQSSSRQLLSMVAAIDDQPGDGDADLLALLADGPVGVAVAPRREDLPPRGSAGSTAATTRPFVRAPPFFVS